MQTNKFTQVVAIAALVLKASCACAANYVLGTTNVTVAASGGTDTLVLGVTPSFGAWSASSGSAWLHLPASSGVGNAFISFTFDPNPSTVLRTGTLTIAGQAVTVTQMGTGYLASPLGVVTVFTALLLGPQDVALDSAGNLYVADEANQVLVKWTATNSAVTTLVPSLSVPYGVAVDGADNVFIANTFAGEIEERLAPNGPLLTNIVSVPGKPVGLAFDTAGNLYFSDIVANTVTRRLASDGSLSTVVSGYNQPYGIALDAAGNIYAADANNHGISRFTPGQGFTVIAAGLNFPQGVAVDGEGNVYYSDGPLLAKWVMASNTTVTLANSGMYAAGITLDPQGNVFIADHAHSAAKEWIHAFVDSATRIEGFAAGTDSLSPVLPLGFNLLPRFAPTSDQPWLTVTGVTNGVISIAFTRNVGPTRTGHVHVLGVAVPIVQYGVALGFSSLVEPPGPGLDSVTLALNPPGTAWSATANDPWLQIAAGSQNGVGSGNILFSFDTNLGATRVGTLTISGETVTIVQAGAGYVAASPMTTLVSSGLKQPTALAVAPSGVVFIADRGNNAIKQWDPASGATTSLGIGGLLNPNGAALDLAGNVYIADTSHSAIKEWLAASQTVTDLVTNGLALPEGLAVDGVGNVYISDSGHNAIKKWAADTGLVTALVASGTTNPVGVAVDIAGNVFFADGVLPQLLEWNATTANVTTLANVGNNPYHGVAVDGGGNVYFADWADASIFAWWAYRGGLYPVEMFHGLDQNLGVAVDAAENVFIANTGDNTIREIPRAFVDLTTRVENPAGGNDALVVLPASVNLQGVFAPSSDQPWLTINGISAGVINFSVTPNYGQGRTGHLIVLGQSVPITQPGVILGTTSLIVGPATGSNSVVLAVDPPSSAWTAGANASWLHMVPGSESGAGSTNVIFAFDPNPGLTRSGTLIIAGFTVTVTQAGAPYVPAREPAPALVSAGLNFPYGLCVDASGNVYIADTFNNAIKKYTPTNNSVTTLVSSGLNNPQAVAVDGAGNVYIADSGNNAVKVWSADTQTVSDLLTNGLNNPLGVAVDGSGNVYIADFGNNAVKEWFVATGNVTNYPVASSGPHGIAVDASGKIYYGEDGTQQLRAYRPGSGLVEILISTNLTVPSAVAVDGSGNVYVADGFNNAIKKWSAATGQITTLVSSNTLSCFGMAIDPSGNVYVADTGHNSILELPGAFVSARHILMSGAAATPSLEPVLPTTQNLLPPFAPTSDQPWLSVMGVSNGAVQLSVPFNDSGSARQGTVTVLGVPVPVTQRNAFMSVITNLLEGPSSGADSIALAVNPEGQSWTAAANDPWLHLVTTNQGAGSTNVIFSFDANLGATRAGTLTIASLSVTVVQAGSTYVPAPSPIGSVITGLSFGTGITFDSAGNVFAIDENGIYEWNRTTSSVTTVLNGQNISGLAIDASGNLYFGNFIDHTLSKWTAATGTVTQLGSVFNDPLCVAVDSLGNVYAGNSQGSSVQVWSVIDGSISTLISGVPYVDELAVDGGDNLYLNANGIISRHVVQTGEWQPIITGPYSGLAIDGSGGIYFGRILQKTISRIDPVTGGISNLFGGLGFTDQLSVDPAKNICVVNGNGNQINLYQRAFVDPAPVLLGPDAGTGVLRPVLPANVCLIGPFTPTSDQPWLTVTGATNGIVSFACTAATAPRTGHILVLGQSISVTQDVPVPSATNLVEGPAAGADSLILAALSPSTPWSVTANANWLHVAPEFQNGSGSGKVVFSFDSNAGATRLGTLTVAGQSVTVTQAGSSYMPAPGTITALVGSGLALPYGLAVDGSGNVYIADTDNNAIKEWVLANNTVTNLGIGGLNNPQGVAVDANGNVVIADTGNNIVKLWMVADGSVSNLVSTNLAAPQGVALDAGGNVYIADFNHNAVKRWNASDGSVTTVVSNLGGPSGVALDFAGNVYTANSGDNTVKEWSRSDGSLNTLVSTGLFAPSGIAVDLAGNVYIADTFHSVVKVWNAASSNLTTIIPNGLSSCFGVAVDAAANLYVADTGHSAIQELPRAFVDASARQESYSAGTDQLAPVLPVSENLLAPFAPTSDRPWLTVTSATNGVVSFAVSATTSNRTGNITVLGQKIAVTQSVAVVNPVTITGMILSNHVFSLSFTNGDAGASFTLLTTTNLTLPLSNWTVLGNATNISGNLFLFIDPAATGQSRYYRSRSP